jgi:hypothetical protein
VFPHEVRNIIGFKRHDVDSDGLAKYPLPPEGQPQNIPRILGGAGTSSSDNEKSVPVPPQQKRWEEGWYLWTTSSLYGSLEKMAHMDSDLEAQRRLELRKEKRQALWLEYLEYLDNKSDATDGRIDQTPGKFYGPRVPPRPAPDVS